MSSEGLRLTNNSGELELSEHNNSPGLAQSLPEEGQTSGAIEKARDHVALIRRSKGLDRLEGQDSTANIEDLEKALDVLSDQLYSQPTHFLLEFIQNADDNSYADVVPTISFTSVSGHLRIDCNEIGFSPANVESICRINNSTKKDRSKGFIGEKGIGFKSVFKIADVVWISSRAYNFKFDRSARLGMIAPIWEDWKDFPGEQYPGHAESDSTQFYLQLSKEKDSHAEKDLLKQLRFFDSTLLLFLRKLKKIEIFVNDDDWKKRFTKHITRSDTHAYGGELITIKKKWAKTKKADETLRYFVVRHNTSDMPMEPKRKGMEASEVVLAFPFIENKPAFHMQKAYAFLPIRDSGFRFLLHADFILIANREDIDKSSQWNDRLLTGLAECFVQAVTRFNSPEALLLRHTWLGFLQNIPKSGESNFSTLADQIVDRLKCFPVLESQGDDFVRPLGAFFIPRAFRDASDRFVLNCAGNCQRYISASYETHDKEHVALKMMGVEIMLFPHFINILKTYMASDMDDFRNQSGEWHALIAKILCEQASDTDLQSLAVIPLQTGRWISKIEGQAHFETREAIPTGKIPEGVPELLIVDQAVSQAPQRRKLLEKLGVKDLNQAEVCRLITNCHVSTKAPELTLDVYISHATYLFEAAPAGVFSPKGKNFWVLDKDGIARESAKMYLDTPDSTHAVSALLDAPSWHSCLLHPAYLLAYKGKKLNKWIKWLQTQLAIRSTIRIAVRGVLTPEFQHLRATRPSALILEILIESWTKEPDQLTTHIKQQLGALDVLCVTGETVHLNKTCLPVPALQDLAPPGIFFVRLSLPLKPVWKKLRELGVVVEPNLAFYLQCLSLAQNQQVTKVQMTKLYKNIDSHWIQDPKLVDEHFSKFDNLAIYVPDRKQWVHRRVCVWESAPGMAAEVVLAGQYPELQSFFFHRLKIPSATIAKVIDELRTNTGHDSLDIRRRKILIFTLSDFLKRSPRDYSKLEALKDVPVMPIADNRYGTSAINIASLNKMWWYFVDQHRYSRCFQNKVAFADFGVEEYARLEPLDRAVQRVWGEHHRLSSSVVEEPYLGSHPTLDANGTNSIREKVKYFRRIARTANPRNSRDLERKLQRLNLVTLYISADMIVKTSVVRGQVGNTTLHGEPIPGKILFRETMTDIQVYVHPSSLKHGKLPPRDTSEELCKVLGIGDERMKRLIVEILFEDDHRDIEDMLSKQRVGGYDANDLEPVLIQVTTQTGNASFSQIVKPPVNVEARPGAETNTMMPSKEASGSGITPSAEPAVLNEMVNESRPSKMPFQGYASSASIPELTAREQKQAARHGEIGASIRIGGWEHVPPQTYPIPQTGYSAKKIKPGITLRPPIRPARKSSPHISNHGRSPVTMTGRDQSREESVGIRGEHGIFNILRDIFGASIDESAWTSELRHHVAGHKPWVPEDPSALYSDFTVRDRNGVLANWMIANEVKVPADWEAEGKAKDMLYHIEVKSTAKPYVDDPFFMSHLQMDKAREIGGTRSPSKSGGPKEVFVIMRVYDVEGEEPGLEVYCDPWGMIERGELSRETQEWKVYVP